ncbi:MAG: hypothetical protein NWQ37_10135 [Marivita lacus]|nr:hypothetical protein [Marivita lacus]
MTPLKIGACLKSTEIENHRDWLFDSARDIEIQDFMSHEALSTEFENRIAAVKAALDGHSGRIGIHGPFEGLDIDNKDAELRPLITARFLKALEAADRTEPARWSCILRSRSGIRTTCSAFRAMPKPSLRASMTFLTRS